MLKGFILLFRRAQCILGGITNVLEHIAAMAGYSHLQLMSFAEITITVTVNELINERVAPCW